MNRTLLTLSLPAAALVLAALPPTQALPLGTVIEGENGIVNDLFCAPDGEIMGPQGIYMFFPHAGCSATYPFLGVTIPLTIQYHTGGNGFQCGHFDVSGGFTGSSNPACSATGVPVVAAVTGTPTGAFGFTLTWQPDNGSPPWVNAWVDSVTCLCVGL